ncbi:unnamed protein product [Caenorhabditis angaria]|uniref:CX domain-containing protein n=1 Tax=Caenorhabditis angaria TaxID=860376 RepID=A0A9P1IDL2_9PELO|nr:unnamed protein product [Caenorhabditis angaria]
MKIVALLFFFAIIFALPHTATTAEPSNPREHYANLATTAFPLDSDALLVRNTLIDYWHQLEKELEPDNRLQYIFIYVEYSDTFKIYKDHSKESNRTVVHLIVHDDDYDKLKRLCNDSRELITHDIETPIRHPHLTINCESVEKKASECPECAECPECCSVLLYVCAIPLISFVFLWVLNRKIGFIDKCRNRRNPVLNEEHEERQPDIELEPLQ